MNPPTLRDYFAAAALQGLLASGDYYTEREVEIKILPSQAYQYADAMIKESEKKAV